MMTLDNSRMRTFKAFMFGAFMAVLVMFALSLWAKREALVKAYVYSEVVASMQINKSYVVKK